MSDDEDALQGFYVHTWDGDRPIPLPKGEILRDGEVVAAFTPIEVRHPGPAPTRTFRIGHSDEWRDL